MSQLVKLEKRFEIALEKLELAFANKNSMKISESPNQKEEIIKENKHYSGWEKHNLPRINYADNSIFI